MTKKKTQRDKSSAPPVYFCLFIVVGFFLMDVTYPEYNGVEEEDEFEEHIGEPMAVADVVVVRHGAAREC